MRSCSLKCFGVGDGWPSPDRKHSSFLYRFGKTAILIDCGDGISTSFKASALDYNTIDRIFLSHLHCDHVGGFFMLMQSFWLQRRKKRLTVHAPADGIAPIRQMMEATFVFDELLDFKLAFKPLTHRRPLTVGDVRVTPFLTSHLEGLRRAHQARHRLAFEAFCFLLEAGQLRLGHSADIGAPEDLAPLLSQPLDLLVCELAHCEAEDLFLYLRDRPIKRIVFVHLARRHWERLAATRQLARKMLRTVPFTFARDGEETVL